MKLSTKWDLREDTMRSMLKASVAALATTVVMTGGALDQPCEVIVRGKELIVVNFDMPFPGIVNTKFDKPYTLSVIKLDD